MSEINCNWPEVTVIAKPDSPVKGIPIKKDNLNAFLTENPLYSK
jgi:hypothetical protein